MGTQAKLFLDLGYITFDLQANFLSSFYLLSRYRHSSASEIPLPEELNRTGQISRVERKAIVTQTYF